MADQSFQYRVCIVRAWKEQHSQDEAATAWRFTLEVPSTSQRRGFITRQELLDALSQEFQDADETSDDGKDR